MSDHILIYFQCLNNRQIAEILCRDKDKWWNTKLKNLRVSNSVKRRNQSSVDNNQAPV